jgi:hypothetical protein
MAHGAALHGDADGAHDGTMSEYVEQSITPRSTTCRASEARCVIAVAIAQAVPFGDPALGVIRVVVAARSTATRCA